jgi:hypothetical protein
MQAVGGGFSAPFASDRALVVTESYRSDRHTWQVAGTLVGGSGAATAYAYCRRKTLPITDHAATETLASGPGETVLVEADCAPKSVAVGGGFHVYCATGIKVPAFTQNQGSASVPLFGSVTQTSVCPPALKPKKGKRRKPKRLLSAGGFDSPFTPGTAVLPVHTDSRIVGKGFIDTAVNGGAGAGTLTVQSQAMCF